MLGTVEKQLSKGPWLLGEKFTAADVLWGMALAWTTGFKLVPESPVIKAYVERANARHSFVKAHEIDAHYASAQ